MADIGRLTTHQFNARMVFLNKMFSDKEEAKPVSQNYGILDQAWGKK